jgi:hypothetical protein
MVINLNGNIYTDDGKINAEIFDQHRVILKRDYPNEKPIIVTCPPWAEETTYFTVTGFTVPQTNKTREEEMIKNTIVEPTAEILAIYSTQKLYFIEYPGKQFYVIPHLTKMDGSFSLPYQGVVGFLHFGEAFSFAKQSKAAGVAERTFQHALDYCKNHGLVLYIRHTVNGEQMITWHPDTVSSLSK